MYVAQCSTGKVKFAQIFLEASADAHKQPKIRIKILTMFAKFERRLSQVSFFSSIHQKKTVEYLLDMLM
jgi:hypothetical protein